MGHNLSISTGLGCICTNLYVVQAVVACTFSGLLFVGGGISLCSDYTLPSGRTFSAILISFFALLLGPILYSLRRHRAKFFCVNGDPSTGTVVISFPIIGRTYKISADQRSAGVWIQDQFFASCDEAYEYLKSDEFRKRGLFPVRIDFGIVTVGPHMMSRRSCMRAMSRLSAVEHSRS